MWSGAKVHDRVGAESARDESTWRRDQDEIKIKARSSIFFEVKLSRLLTIRLLFSRRSNSCTRKENTPCSLWWWSTYLSIFRNAEPRQHKEHPITNTRDWESMSLWRKFIKNAIILSTLTMIKVSPDLNLSVNLKSVMKKELNMYRHLIVKELQMLVIKVRSRNTLKVSPPWWGITGRDSVLSRSPGQGSLNIQCKIKNL